MSEIEKLKNALVWHDYAARYMLDGISALLVATDSDVTPDERRKARNAAIYDMQTAYRGLEQAKLVQTIKGEDE